jgi:hypothetical protein
MDEVDETWEFDLSTLNYPQFLATFFDHPIADDKYDAFWPGICSYVATNPTLAASHLRDMCRDFAELPKIYAEEQLDQGLWMILGPVIRYPRFCFDPAIDIAMRIDAIESMYIPFRDVVALHTGDIKDTFYWMWWDEILFSSFWEDDWRQGSGRAYDYAALTHDRKKMGEVILRTLLRILALDHRGCQWCALHGLGHLHYPSGRAIVQGYLDAHGSECTDEDVKWIEGCRDGRVQ